MSGDQRALGALLVAGSASAAAMRLLDRKLARLFGDFLLAGRLIARLAQFTKPR